MAGFGLLFTANMAVSSANVEIIVLSVVGISAVNMRYKNGPNKLPCGTPDLIGWFTNASRLYLVWKKHTVR